MIHFLFGTLWSVLFWIAYFGLSILATTLILKELNKEAFNYITKNGEPWSTRKVDIESYIGSTILFLIFWQVVAVFLFVRYSLGKILWPAICKLIAITSTSIPTIEFEKQNEKNGEEVKE